MSANSYATLVTAINTINTSPGATPSYTQNTLTLTGSFSLAGPIPVLRNGVQIVGGGNTITGANNRMFATYNNANSTSASILFSNVTLTGGLAAGGAGAAGTYGGGGGGLGAGGGIYVDNKQTLILSNTTISSCVAKGGAGGATGSGSSGGAGGGASFSTIVNSATASGTTGGGDNPGTSTSAGGTTYGEGSDNGYGAGNGGGNGSGYLGTPGIGSASTVPPVGNSTTNANGANGGYFGGGGGAGLNSPYDYGAGGGGGNGGGTGSNLASAQGGAGGGYGSGGGASINPGAGGGGGFGGGGGGALLASGGGGGWGAGGGGGYNYTISGGKGGHYGGDGVGSPSGPAAGGGGGGVGGGVFVGDASTLQIQDGVTFSNNSALGGLSGAGAASGQPTSSTPSDIFLFRGATLQFTGTTGYTTGSPFAASIQSDTYSGSALDGGVIINTASNSTPITFSSTSNNYRGNTTITKGTLNAGGSNLSPSSTITVSANGTFNLTSGTSPTVIINNGGTVNLAGSLLPANTSTNTSLTNVNASGALTIPTTYSNSGTIAVAANGALNVGGALSGIVTNAGTTTLTAAFTPANTSTNTSQMHINTNGSFTQPATYTNTGTININTGTAPLSNTLTGGAGCILNIGNANSVAYVSGVPTITNVPTINLVTSGTTFTTSNPISGVTSQFSTGVGTTATLNAVLSGTGGAINNAGNLILGINNAVTTTGAFTNAATGAIYVPTTFTPNAVYSSFTNNGAVNVYGPNGVISGAFAGNGGTSSINFGKDINNNLYNNTYTTTGTITNTPNIRVYSGTLTTASTNSISGVTGGLIIDSGNAAATFAATYNGSGPVSNNGTLTISNVFGTGTINNTGTLYLSSGTNSINSNIVNLGGTINVNSQATVNAANTISNSGNMHINHAFSSGAITNTSSGIITLASGANQINSPITNQANGNINVTSQATYINTITNQGAMTISAQLSGNGAINNSNMLDLQTGANVANTITNTGNMTATGNVAVTNTVTNNNSLSVSGSLTMTGQALNSTGTVTLDASADVNVGTYTNSNLHTTTIADASNYGTLTATGPVNLAGSDVQVLSNVTTAGEWTIITAGFEQLTEAQNVILPPNQGGFFGKWYYFYDPATTLVIKYDVSALEPLAVGEVNQAIAAALDQMNSNQPLNSGQQILINAIYASPDSEVYNANLQQLMPLMNASAANISIQDSIFTKIETRIASLDSRVFDKSGIAAGDINDNNSIWLGGFASISKQYQNGENFGYKSTGFGSIIGLDHRMHNDRVFGLGLAVSKTIVREDSNQDFVTSIIGFHGLFYTTLDMPYAAFLETLVTGAITNYKGSRKVNISNVIMSTTSSYDGGQGAIRLNYGKEYGCNDLAIFSPMLMVQYAGVYLPNYTEAYSPAALDVQPKHYQNILTIGTGARLSLPCDEWWLLGTRELRITGTYDAISSDNVVSSNFVVGSPDFILTNPPAARLALIVGIDLSFQVLDHLHLDFSYDYEMRQMYHDISASIRLKYVF